MSKLTFKLNKSGKWQPRETIDLTGDDEMEIL
jgi:hypothetical protein